MNLRVKGVEFLAHYAYYEFLVEFHPDFVKSHYCVKLLCTCVRVRILHVHSLSDDVSAYALLFLIRVLIGNFR